MKPQVAYTHWSEQYDSNENKTRDMEAAVLRKELQGFSFQHCLEIGCGTGKNTEWLAEKATAVTAIDLTEAMLEKARQKIKALHVQFLQGDILKPWTFATGRYDLITFSLVLEHIESLTPVFEQVDKVLAPGGLVYIGELHPFKQYSGSKARFETAEGVQVVECFTHHVSDFIHAAFQFRLSLVQLNEYFDEDNRNGMPRVLSLLFRKQ
jgi:2-polyprenyl-3-methyl-5-hydroxy-6-metoxy-1,4-benzoquinol methylase